MVKSRRRAKTVAADVVHELTGVLSSGMSEQSLLFRFLPPVNARRSLTWRYVAAVLTSLFFIALRWSLSPIIGYDTPFAILFVGIALSAFYGGLGPGLVSLLTSLALADYFLSPPLYTLGLPDTKAVLSNFLFGVAGLVVCVLGELGRSAALQASQEADLRKLAQQHALVSEERLRVTEQVVAGGVWEWEIPSQTVYWSDGYRRLLDYPMDERPSQDKWLQSVHAEDRERVSAMVDELFRKNLHHWSAEYRILTASHRTRWIASHGRVFYDPTGQPKRLVGINVDVTARRLAEEAEHKNEAKIRLLMQYARVGDWEWNPHDGSIKCSAEFYEVTGLDPSVSPMFNSLIAYVHSADRERVRELLTRLQDSPGRDFDFENRVVGSDGVERLIHTRGAVIRDTVDGSVRVVGIAIDLARRDNEMLAS
jgi:PAS domain S-box-containing protein